VVQTQAGVVRVAVRVGVHPTSQFGLHGDRWMVPVDDLFGRVLGLPDFVSLEDNWGTGKLDSSFGEGRYEDLTERLKLLPRVPNLTYQDVSIRAKEADVVVETWGRPDPPRDLLQCFPALVIFLGSQRRGAEADDDAHGGCLLLGSSLNY